MFTRRDILPDIVAFTTQNETIVSGDLIYKGSLDAFYPLPTRNYSINL